MAVEKNRISRVRQHQLNNLVIDEYATKNLADIDFAAYATVKLGFNVTSDNVGDTRRDFGIPSTGMLKKQVRARTVEDRISALEEAIAELKVLLR